MQELMPFPVDIKYISQTEEKLGVKFPPAFLVKMAKLNGGSVTLGSDDFELHPFMDTSDRKRLARTASDIVRETAAARQWSGFPQDAVSIGANGCGDFLVLVPSQINPAVLAQEVYWWDHETGELNKVADDFSELS